MEISSETLNELRELFVQDDGSLPEFRVEYSSAEGVLAGVAVLSDLLKPSDLDSVKVWSESASKELNVGSLSAGATMVTSGDAEPFHIFLKNIEFRDSMLPDLGVFIFQRQLAIDYRMGSDWTPARVDALFGLLLELTRPDPESSVHLENGVIQSLKDKFLEVWGRWTMPSAV